ncbi:hypothetical protein OO015_08120 [Thermomicrobium sp. 4228-Ro]|uniref:hypothetical protein n=1 Tax=Thermomicrobium sp. 4228-Ro TaxID=2993937 RepID=UPI002249333B|nr:hypothetical protein [Thermomicrobium sp. 4228-Ro]MCX2727458.1 hypothetical protein [Thermomicrobium sp. 4228-Ro]
MLQRIVTLRRTLAVALAVAAMAGLLVTAGLVAAQTATPTPSSGNATNPCSAIGTKQGGKLDDLLSALVNEGIVSQEQADRIRQYLASQAQTRCYQAQVLPAADILSTAANKLGITTSQLALELRQGKSLAQIAAEHNVSRDDLKNALLQAAQSNANALVQQGILTQEEANQALQAVQSNLDTLLDQTGLRGFKRGFGWGRGWHHGFGRGWDEEQNQRQQKSSQSGLRLAPGLHVSSQ